MDTAISDDQHGFSQRTPSNERRPILPENPSCLTHPLPQSRQFQFHDNNQREHHQQPAQKLKTDQTPQHNHSRHQRRRLQ
ncbi:hypothetical protein EMPG_17639 [Blastomyces silverae]|uniref:Uncharacterized protein n=1 Tax=Blastomyces silverae TaxID=2060906 RepID=A0A0H1B626_9EURO|nr:hypothetical protein EMPG_17639 [Blastomyces silverae]